MQRAAKHLEVKTSGYALRCSAQRCMTRCSWGYRSRRWSSRAFLRCLALSSAGRSDSETFVQALSLFLAEVIHSPGEPCISASGGYKSDSCISGYHQPPSRLGSPVSGEKSDTGVPVQLRWFRFSSPASGDTSDTCV